MATFLMNFLIVGFITSFRLLNILRPFEGKECLHLQALECQRTQRPVPEERNPRLHRCDNFETGKSLNILNMSVYCQPLFTLSLTQSEYEAWNLSENAVSHTDAAHAVRFIPGGTVHGKG